MTMKSPSPPWGLRQSKERQRRHPPAGRLGSSTRNQGTWRDGEGESSDQSEDGSEVA